MCRLWTSSRRQTSKLKKDWLSEGGQNRTRAASTGKEEVAKGKNSGAVQFASGRGEFGGHNL